MCGIGDACAEAGLFDKAEEIYKHVVGAYAGDESVLWARKDLCLLRMRMGDAAGADGAISQLAGDFAGDARLSQHLCELADGWRRYNEEARARTLYQHVIETWPGQTWAMWSAKNLIAMEIEESEDPDGPLESIPPPILETVDAMISGYKEQAELPHAVFLIGEEYYGLGEKARKVGARQWEANFSKSVIVWGKVIEELATGPYTLMARDYRGGACRAIGDYSAALDDYEWLAEGCPDYERHWHACFMVIRCYEDMAATRLLTNKEAAAGIIPAVERLIKGYPEWSERLKADRMIKRWEFMASLGEGVQ
jgi:tetratricopeptide (TPR) repeat protein